MQPISGTDFFKFLTYSAYADGLAIQFIGFINCFDCCWGVVNNNIFDQQETDLVNNPKKVVGVSISETQAYNIYLALTSSGVVLLGFTLANVIAKPSFAIFILIRAYNFMQPVWWNKWCL
jgi:4-hydroxybenzoate polyprenyltransferase